MQHQDERAQLCHRRGYVTVRAFLPDPEIKQVRDACDLALEGARAQSIETGHTTHRISLLADPSYFAADPRALECIANFASSPRVCTLVSGLTLNCEGRIPRLKTIDYYHEQTRHDWDGDWHRDIQFGEPDPVNERRRLTGAPSAHMRVALESDDRLEIVPSSHLRWDTLEELSLRKGAERASSAMPNATRISLRRGDACVFHAASIHRATYRRIPIRRTIDMVFVWGGPAEG